MSLETEERSSPEGYTQAALEALAGSARAPVPASPLHRLSSSGALSGWSGEAGTGARAEPARIVDDV